MEQYKLPERKFFLCLRSLGMAKLWAVILGVMLTTLALAQTSAPAAGELTAARMLFQQGNFSGAAAAFQKIIDRQPSADAHAGLVESFLKLDDVPSAEERSRLALEQFPQSPLIHATRGDVYFRRGLMAEAQGEYETALKMDAKCARAWLRCFRSSGRSLAGYSRRRPAATARSGSGRASQIK